MGASLLGWILLFPSPQAADPSGPIHIVDLASESAWTISLDGGPERPIRVPGGGYNSLRAFP